MGEGVFMEGFFLGGVYACAMSYGCVARFPSLSIRQLSGVESCVWNIRLYWFLDL